MCMYCSGLSIVADLKLLILIRSVLWNRNRQLFALAEPDPGIPYLKNVLDPHNDLDTHNDPASHNWVNHSSMFHTW
jgi:hypothetical protein